VSPQDLANVPSLLHVLRMLHFHASRKRCDWGCHSIATPSHRAESGLIASWLQIIRTSILTAPTTHAGAELQNPVEIW
jgi:hypothetical protein